MKRSTLQDRRRPRALLLLALLLHLLGAAFAPAAHARFVDVGEVPSVAAVPPGDAAHDDLSCAVCLALHSPALPTIGVAAAAPENGAAAPSAAVGRSPSTGGGSALRARAPPLQ